MSIWHVGVDGGRKLCPPSTLTGLLRVCKPYWLREWIAELVEEGGRADAAAGA